MRMCGMPPKSKASLHLPQFTCRVHLAFQFLKKLLEASGTFFCFSQSDFVKKKNFHVKKKTCCEAKLTTPSNNFYSVFKWLQEI